jgi:lipid-A-disaccharide synthase
MVVVYRVAPISWWLARSLVRVPHVAMANLIAGRRLVPELLQGEVRPDRAADEVEGILTDGERRSEIKRGLGEVRAALGEPGAAGRAAEAVLEALARSKEHSLV